MCTNGKQLSMKLVIGTQAVKALRKMQRKTCETILTRLAAIAEAPFARHANVERLIGTKDGFRVRVGGWRATYRLDRGKDEMQVVRIKPRGEVYKR